MAQAHQLPACTLPTLASDQRQPTEAVLNVPNRVYLGDGWHSTCRGSPRVPHPAKQSRLPTVPSLVYALSFSIGIPASTSQNNPVDKPSRQDKPAQLSVRSYCPSTIRPSIKYELFSSPSTTKYNNWYPTLHFVLMSVLIVAVF